MGQFVIAALVSNQSGVLTRVSGMFTRRGFNIDSLTVGETENPALSRITIAMRGDAHDLDQILKQLRKLHDVTEVRALPHSDTVFRELLLIKVRNDPAVRGEISAASDAYEGKIVDFTKDSIIIQMIGDSRKIDNFVTLMKEYEILEICRTGIVALQRGSTTIRKVNL